MRLKKCPFCGGNATVEMLGGCITVFQYFAKCECCGVKTQEYSNEELAAKKWNTRQEDNGVILVEDGSVDLEECENLGFRPLVYRKGSALPKILKDEER